MTKHQIIALTDISLITCIVQRGCGDDIVEAAQHAGSQGATIHFARGTGVRERLGMLRVATEAEKEIVDIVVANDQVDRVFECIFVAGKLGTPGRGMIYVTPLEKAATYIPNDVLEKLERQGAVHDDT